VWNTLILSTKRLTRVPDSSWDFGDSETLEFGLQVFIDRKPEYYTFADKTKKMTEAQIYEMYAPKG